MRLWTTQSIEFYQQFEVESEKALLSDHGYWHMVLNDSYLSNSTNEAEWELDEEWFDALSEKEKTEEKTESWERIFNLDTSRNNEWHRVGDDIQATVWEVRWEQVRKVQFFTAR